MNFSRSQPLGWCALFSTRFLLITLPVQVGQEIEVRPGIVSKTSDGKIQCTPIHSRIVSLFAEHNELQYAAPGGLIGQ